MKRKKRKKLLIIAIGLFLILVFMPVTTYATVPGTINYQGYLTNSSGDPIDTGGEPPLSITFRLYTVPNGGTAFWNETLSVSVIDGIYSVILGETNSLLDENLTDPCYLGVKVGSDSEMTPRQKLTGAAFAIRADFAEDAGDSELLDGLDSTDFLSISSDYGRSGVSSTLYEGTSTLTSKYVDEGQANSITAGMVAFNYAGSSSEGGAASNLICTGCVSSTDADSNSIQTRVSGTCEAGSSIRVISSTGTVTCEPDTDTNTQLSEETVESYIANDVTTSYIPYDDGTKLIDSGIYYNGNVGIGDSTPSAKLDVAGDISTSGAYKIDGITAVTAETGITAIGRSAGHTAGSTSLNTLIGNNAGENTGSGGVENTFIGNYAGATNTTADHNVYIGSQAGRNATGGYNVFIGDKAGYSNTDNRNNFIGFTAGYQNTTGVANNFLGFATGFNSVSGSNNTFIGNAAGYGNTGNGNVFLGYQAGYYEPGSNKLYISNSGDTTPLIHGDFENDKVTINGDLEVAGKIKLTLTKYQLIANSTTGNLTMDTAVHNFCAISQVSFQTANPGTFKQCIVNPKTDGSGKWEFQAIQAGYQAGVHCSIYCF